MSFQMNDVTISKQPFNLIFIAIIIALGIAVNGFFIGYSIFKFKSSDRSIAVKGFSEKDVKSDFAELVLTFKNPANDLDELQKKNELDTKNVLAFFKSKGIKDEEVFIDSTDLIDRQTREYGGDRDKQEYRYILTTRIKVVTKGVDLIRDISNQTVELIKQQININPVTSYYFTKFADLRTQMIAEATQSARQAALQFAKDSGSRVGEIRHAVQGAFSITGPNSEYNELNSVYKKIRVVTSVTFNLVD